jgi:hypothetical protein
MTTHTTSELRELDHRVSDGIEVQLLWRPSDDRALVAVSDAKTGEAFTIGSAPTSARSTSSITPSRTRATAASARRAPASSCR